MGSVEIHSSKGLAIALMVVGALCALLSLVVQQWLGAVSGALIAGLGAALLSRPMMMVRPEVVELKNPLGMTLRKVPIKGFGDLQLDGDVLYRAGDRKRIRSLGFGGARPEDRAALEIAISQGRQAGGAG